jgi:protein-serine/threonine kinase
VNDDHSLQLAVYDHSNDDDYFLGVVNLRPRLSHGQASDVWLKLQGREEGDVVTGEIRVQYSYTRSDVRRRPRFAFDDLTDSQGKRSLTVKDFDFLRMIGKGTFGWVPSLTHRRDRRLPVHTVASSRSASETRSASTP